MPKSLRTSSERTFVWSVLALCLLATSDTDAQPTANCLIFEGFDCQGEPAISGNFLDQETCLSWLESPAYGSVLWDPNGAAVCTNAPALPVELVSLFATVSQNRVHLEWTTASETNNAGFEIEQRTAGGDFGPVGFVAGMGTVREARNYRYDVTDLTPNRYVFRLRQVDFDGSFAYSSEVEALVTVPDRFVLEEPYPNPFNPTSTVRFAAAREQDVSLTLSDALGRRVAVLFEGRLTANETKSVSIDGNNLPPGFYVVTLRGDGFSKSVGLELVK